MRTYLIIFMFLVLTTGNHAQQESNAKDAANEGLVAFRFSNTIPNSAVLITIGGSQSPKQKRGTGFLLIDGNSSRTCRSIYDKKKDTNPCRILLVTNKHVLPAEGDDSPVFLTVRNSGNADIPDIEIEVMTGNGRYASTVRTHPRGYDIAAVDVTHDLEKINLANFSILPASILAVHCSPPDGIRALPAALGDPVLILGYPSGIYNQKNVYPILRSGIIATDPNIPFEFNAQLRDQLGFPDKIDGFLIDAAIFPGSSGSLVLRKPINYEFPNAPYAIGIISDSIPIDDPELKSAQRIGLAVVYSSDAISETLALFK